MNQIMISDTKETRKLNQYSNQHFVQVGGLIYVKLKTLLKKDFPRRGFYDGRDANVLKIYPVAFL